MLVIHNEKAVSSDENLRSATEHLAKGEISSALCVTCTYVYTHIINCVLYYVCCRHVLLWRNATERPLSRDQRAGALDVAGIDRITANVRFIENKSVQFTVDKVIQYKMMRIWCDGPQLCPQSLRNEWAFESQPGVWRGRSISVLTFSMLLSWKRTWSSMVQHYYMVQFRH